MARFVLLRRIIPTKFLAAGVGLFALALLHVPLASAQRPVRPVGGGHTAAPVHPPVVPRPIMPPPQRAPFAPLAHPQNVPLQHTLPVFHRPRFVHQPFFRFRQAFVSPWWLSCGPLFTWNYGCNDLFLYGYGVPYPPTPLIYENSPAPVYSYLPLDRELVHLYLQDGTMIAVSDYWFVNNQLHFIAAEEDGSASEQVIGASELDLQKTVEVNTRRGFRLVRRDQPLEQYLRNHPEANAPLLEPPPKT